MLKVLAFDLGNTLTDDAKLLASAIKATAVRLQSLFPKGEADRFAEVYRRVNESTRLPFISHTYGELSFFEAAFRELGDYGNFSRERPQHLPRFHRLGA